jgi:DNA-directed RNA polymerase specialized sigma24 family protein
MSEERPHPKPEECERTYRILVGMASRKRFLTDQDREDFVQDVMLSAFRSYDADRQGGLSFKNLACGPAFRRAYQSYWRRFYRSPSLRSLQREPCQPKEQGRESILHGKHEGRALMAAALAGELKVDECQELPSRDEEPPTPRRMEYASVEVEELCDQTTENPTDLLLMQVLFEEIEHLEAPLSQLMVLFLYGMTRDEVARTMGKSLSWAKKYTLKALHLLIKRLKARGVIVETFELEQLLI